LGQKTTFGSESEDEGDAGGGEARADGGSGKAKKDKGHKKKDKAAEEEGKEGRKEKKRQRGGDVAAAAAPAGDTDADADGPKVKWVKLAVAQLERAPKRRMRWSALWAALWEDERVSGAGLGAKQAKAAAWERISVSSRVAVDGRKLRLAAATT
jgi:hypothetical protein